MHITVVITETQEEQRDEVQESLLHYLTDGVRLVVDGTGRLVYCWIWQRMECICDQQA